MLTRREFIRNAAAVGAQVYLLSNWSPKAWAQASEIRIGTLCPLTGAGSPFGPGMQKGIEMAAQAINEAGGLLGRPVRLFSEDSQTDPESAVRAAKKLIEINQVQAILGTWSSGVTMAISPICIENRVINMNTSGSTEIPVGPAGQDYIWRATGSNVLYGEVFARWALSKGYRRASFLAYNNPSGRTLGEEFQAHFNAGGGTTNLIVYNPNQPSYRAELNRALSTRPEVIALGSYLEDTAILLKEAYALGVDVPWIGPNWAVSDALVQMVGPYVAEGVLSVSAVPNMDTEAFRKFEQDFVAATGQTPLSNPFGAMGYDMMTVVGLAIEAARSDLAVDFRTQIRNVSRPPGKKVYSFAEGVAELRKGNEIDYDGVSSNMDFTDSGEVRPAFGIWEVRAGQFDLRDIVTL